MPHHGGAKKVKPAQQRPHRLSGSSTVSPQPRQRGGSTASTTARPIRSNRLDAQPAKLAGACIDTHHQVTTAFVNERLRCGMASCQVFYTRGWMALE